MHRNLGTALFAATLILGVAPAVSAASGVALAPHRAVYDMKLGDIDANSGLAGLNGLMVYDFSGNACDGYSVSFRFVTEFQDTSGSRQVTDLRTTSFEAPDAQSYQFLSKTYVDQKLSESTKGEARVEQGGKQVNLSEPDERSLEIASSAMFPTEHLKRIINAAFAGEKFVAADIYDGSETGDKVYATTTVIGAAKTGDLPADAVAAMKERLKDSEHWPVTIAYFDPAKDQVGEETPAYQLSFVLYENGISRRLNLDYGDFTIEGKLRELEFYDHAPCAAE
ncbi:uncharacterized protein DUF1849 [Roseibium hamelinense]|uniref:Uncharacterized protein DUF1849 n=1 Tax=Roseibium hamelinense TaxID=150831 RepID=A0A562SFH7_9HYPH|nr:cell envelope integrity EipB family protein [Roseibium hamelinense]MTI44208.1 DUF1849 family protein [Roseibium hamelinense]TWI80008.1 uncharacterized protein DUF1849 [Roseibium hamelinense]